MKSVTQGGWTMAVEEGEVTHAPEIKFLEKDPIQAIQGFLELLNWIDNDWAVIFDQIGNADKETQDLLHEIELSHFNAFEGFKLSKEIQNVRQWRRQLKNLQEVLEPFNDFCNANKNLRVNLFKVMNQMVKRQENQEHKTYTPRVRTDLKIATGD
jgi:L-ribulose-5-phosphate 3-epimerase UlaE